MTDIIALRLVIRGRVQAVHYRKTAQARARALTLRGWTRNLPDATVEIVVQGEEFQLVQFVNWCYRGPERARVTDVHIERTAVETADDFVVLPDGSRADARSLRKRFSAHVPPSFPLHTLPV
ncbi:MAG: acylphosphatase [Proteobacteria bacterium]|nr:acylphosphatase [Pseudomonadota bacterium]